MVHVKPQQPVHAQREPILSLETDESCETDPMSEVVLRIVLVLGAWCTFVSPASAHAQDRQGAVRIEVNGDAIVGPGDPRDLLVVIGGNARIADSVGTVIIVDGSLALNDARVGHIFAVQANVEVGPGSRVSHQIQLIDSEMSVDPDARVYASIRRGVDLRRGAVVFGVLIGIGFSVAVVLAGLGAAAVAPSLVREAGAAITERTGPTLLSALVVWVVLPTGALFLLFTLVGAPTAVGVLLVLPLLWFAGYIVSGIRLGDYLLRRLRGVLEPVHPYRAAGIGLVVLVMAGWLPFIGSVISPVAGLLGSGSLAFIGWQRFATGRPPRSTVGQGTA